MLFYWGKCIKLFSRRTLGNQAENLAKRYLIARGLLFIAQQYRIRNGEIDLIMRSQQELIFIEVRYRQQTLYADPLETIDWHKQQCILRTASHFCLLHPWSVDYDIRFDVISISGDIQTAKITWIPDAFRVE